MVFGYCYPHVACTGQEDGHIVYDNNDKKAKPEAELKDETAELKAEPKAKRGRRKGKGKMINKGNKATSSKKVK